MSRSDAYTALLMRHCNMLWRMCRRHAHGDYARCCDLMQEVSIALWLNYDKLYPGVTLHQERAWVYWQARSVFDQVRRRRQLSAEPLTDTLADQFADEDTLRRQELLDDMLSALDPEERCLVDLYLKGYRGDEIGRQMGLSRNAVYQRMHRAVQKMKRVALILLALLSTTAVAVAVVPQWREFFFGKSEPEKAVSDTVPTQPHSEPAIATPPSDTVVCMSCNVLRPKLEHLEPKLPMLVPEVFLLPDTLPPLSPQKEVTISVNGNLLTIVGANDEEVRVYDMNGELVASRYGYGVYFIALHPRPNPFFYERNYYQIKIGTRPTLLLRL